MLVSTYEPSPTSRQITCQWQWKSCCGIFSVISASGRSMRRSAHQTHAIMGECALLILKAPRVIRASAPKATKGRRVKMILICAARTHVKTTGPVRTALTLTLAIAQKVSAARIARLTTTHAARVHALMAQIVPMVSTHTVASAWMDFMARTVRRTTTNAAQTHA